MAEPAPAPTGEPRDIRPVVAMPSGGRAVWIFAALLLAVGGGLFYALQMRRIELENPSRVAPQPDAETMIASPPALVIPGGVDTYAVPMAGIPPVMPSPGGVAALTAPTVPAAREGRYAGAYAPPPRTDFARSASYPPIASPIASSITPAFAYQAPIQAAPGAATGIDAKAANSRVEAGRLANPATTVPQGSVIQAVMETALDSTRPGYARAIVSRDVEGFDGTRVLIPRGSKLFGEYQADVNLGQKRALIQWHRLTRPDGTIIDIDSPSADPLGRAGVKGDVNTHFFQRFSGAILQSALDIGVQAATRKVGGDTVVVALPNSTQVASPIQRPDEIKPTLKIPQGASVSVFVIRDLDFTAAER